MSFLRTRHSGKKIQNLTWLELQKFCCFDFVWWLVYRLVTEEPWFDSRQGRNIYFSSPKPPDKIWGTQPTIQCVHGAGEIRWLGRESNQSPPSSDKVKNVWMCNSVSHMHSLYGAYVNTVTYWHWLRKITNHRGFFWRNICAHPLTYSQ
jgi:hypothetical protein